jgi:acetylornithine/N-succinyldiaminopimelate aminotransferase
MWGCEPIKWGLGPTAPTGSKGRAPGLPLIDFPHRTMVHTPTMFPALMPTYARADIAFERGEGAWLVATDGRRYLDFGAGIATSSLGHGHPHLTAAIAEQAARVMHVSNLYRVPQAERLAERLVAATFADSVFFCSSGAEANEGMVKMVRRAMSETGRPERYRMICFEGAFHGRTLAMLSATGNPKYLAGFGPVVDGFDHVPFGNMNAVRNAITAETAGILVEPIQGEGGVRPAPEFFLRDLRAACDEFGLFLVLDEVQCGMGRTGKLFAHEHAGIVPDALSAAKGIAGGFPMGAILARELLAKHLPPGSHGTTFGGNPLACAAANAVLDVLLAPGFLDQIAGRGRVLKQGLQDLAESIPQVFSGVRGLGLMLGLLCVVPNTEIQAACIREGLLTVAAGENVLRLVPPLIVTPADIEAALARLRRAALTCLPQADLVAAK